MLRDTRPATLTVAAAEAAAERVRDDRLGQAVVRPSCRTNRRPGWHKNNAGQRGNQTVPLSTELRVSNTCSASCRLRNARR
jgi:hypothetical protein